jgi:hypothetical protein
MRNKLLLLIAAFVFRCLVVSRFIKQLCYDTSLAKFIRNSTPLATAPWPGMPAIARPQHTCLRQIAVRKHFKRTAIVIYFVNK